MTRPRRHRFRFEFGGNSWHLTVDPSNLNLPRVMVYGDERDRIIHVGLSWGNGNSDPVWSVGFPLVLPAFLGRKVRY
jgi:hypothetical protein